MCRVLMLVALGLVLFALWQKAHAAVIVNQVIRISITVTVPCVNNGAGASS